MTLEYVLEQTNKFWRLDSPLLLPRPGWLICPICHTEPPRIRFWRYHKREKSETTPFRCDISFKCVGCANVWLHGVVIPESYWAQRPLPSRDGMTISWKNGRRYVEEWL